MRFQTWLFQYNQWHSIGFAETLELAEDELMSPTLHIEECAILCVRDAHEDLVVGTYFMGESLIRKIPSMSELCGIFYFEEWKHDWWRFWNEVHKVAPRRSTEYILAVATQAGVPIEFLRKILWGVLTRPLSAGRWAQFDAQTYATLRAVDAYLLGRGGDIISVSEKYQNYIQPTSGTLERCLDEFVSLFIDPTRGNFASTMTNVVQMCVGASESTNNQLFQIVREDLQLVDILRYAAVPIR